MLGRIEFSIPGRPIPWERPRHRAGQVAMFNTKRTTAAKKAVVAYARQAMAGRAMLTGALKMEVLCVYAVPASWAKAKRKAAFEGRVWKTSVPDLDNLAKLCLDSLNGLAFADDAMVAVLSVAKRYGSPERTVVRVSELEGLDKALEASGLPEAQPRLEI